ncbi:hypothetical protein [[Mycobacterium] burgundiense]|uniref:Scaffolding protein n=1 Tax=[Mycobacterium] burgundiense TaxID=3064286 RepID=A0ABM9L9B9_9MYCO|nr:hypothetical protein [Mycolicibacterium sp. MU0053]CAJ1495105.1 hypothetical protein MU0053_000271 [Mycolicibacterium sp. MU0053]
MTDETTTDATEVDTTTVDNLDTEATSETTEPTGVDLESDPEATEDDDNDSDPAEDRGGRDAAKYRRKLRTAEAERDQLAERLEAMQRNEIERQAQAAQLKPAALWAAAKLDDLLAEDGTVSTEAVAQAVETARETLGVPPPRRNHVAGEGRNPRTARRTGRDAMTAAVMGSND